jgi:hypothetical protein
MVIGARGSEAAGAGAAADRVLHVGARGGGGDVGGGGVGVGIGFVGAGAAEGLEEVAQDGDGGGDDGEGGLHEAPEDEGEGVVWGRGVGLGGLLWWWVCGGY